MTVTYQKTKDTITKITSHEEVFDVKKLNTELEEIEVQIKELEKEPDEITAPNDEKFMSIDMLNNRKNKIKELLK